MKVAAGILERYQRYGWTEPAGEWGVIQNEDRRAFREALESGDPDQVDMVLEDFLRGPLTYGLVSFPSEPEQLANCTLWRLALWAKMARDPKPERLMAPVVGNPLTTVQWDIPIMIDAPRFDRYASVIADVLPEGGTMLELGGGYGGVALQVRRRRPDVRAVLVDIPETLYLAWYWLANAGESVAWADSDHGESILLHPVRAPNWVCCDADLVFSAHTLSGLAAEDRAGFFEWLAKYSARYFYHDDAVDVAGAGVWMTDRFPEALTSDIKPPSGFALKWSERIPWIGLTDRFGEFFYERVA